MTGIHLGWGILGLVLSGSSLMLFIQSSILVLYRSALPVILGGWHRRYSSVMRVSRARSSVALMQTSHRLT